MAYKIKIISGTDDFELLEQLQSLIAGSRFTISRIDIITPRYKRFATLSLHDIRLKKPKPYCGNHAGACVRPHHGPHRKGRYLEGADWVAFNDGINDLLDRLGVSAIVASSVCEIRRGEFRRCAYTGKPGGEFEKEGREWQWMSGIGITIGPSHFPPGTPGLYQFKEEA